MNPSTLVLYTGAENATVTLRIAGLNWTGSLAEIEITPRPGADAILLSSAPGGALALVPEVVTDLVITYGEELISGLEIGDFGRWSGFRTVGDVREPIGGGKVVLGGPGQFFGPAMAVVATGAPQGVPGQGINVILVDHTDWPPADDANPLNWYVRLADES
ncbi:hypothetical protein [Ancylobacter sp. FA202]|uniref:hypothetical protein n=1 Tax=Ancylobacter sp. FA202 TaxID=1111106 RepID=UPI00035C56D7|nr:hypothetical protein [Ancylobacter sp. FA202]